MLDEECKVMATKIPAGLEEGVDDLSESFNKEIENMKNNH